MTDPRSAASRRFVLGMTGGSGASYALRLLEVLLAAGARVQLVASGAARRVLRHESGIELGEGPEALRSLVRAELRDGLEVFDIEAVESSPASGSARIDGVVVCPCSMGTLARIAHGFSSNLVERAADVALKERRRLIVVPRETPLSTIHLRNLLLLAEAGAVVLPAMPGFYMKPQVKDVEQSVAGRVADGHSKDSAGWP